MARKATEQVAKIGIDIGKNSLYLIGLEGCFGSHLAVNDRRASCLLLGVKRKQSARKQTFDPRLLASPRHQKSTQVRRGTPLSTPSIWRLSSKSPSVVGPIGDPDPLHPTPIHNAKSAHFQAVCRPPPCKSMTLRSAPFPSKIRRLFHPKSVTYQPTNP